MRRPDVMVGILLLLLPASVRAAEEKADFLIVPNPGHLALYDQFQHRMSDREKKALPRGIAFRVLDARALLGDGIIPCVRAEFAGVAFYLERESQSSLTGLSRQAGATLIELATVRSDTVDLRRQLELTDAEDHRTHLAAGERIVLLLESRGRTYVMTLAGTPRCGWVSLLKEERGTVWVTAESGRHSPSLSESEVRRRITPIVDRANRLFVMLARELADETGQSVHAPVLHVTPGGDSITLHISGSPHAETFRGTLRALKARIQAELPGLAVNEDPLQSSLTVSGW